MAYHHGSGPLEFGRYVNCGDVTNIWEAEVSPEPCCYGVAGPEIRSLNWDSQVAVLIGLSLPSNCSPFPVSVSLAGPHKGLFVLVENSACLALLESLVLL